MKSVFLFCLPLMSACTLGLNTMDKTIDTGSVSELDTGDIVDTGISVDTAEDTGADTNTDTDTQTDSDTDTEDTSTPTTDVDQDGFSVEDGDCDDYDPFINPVQLDDCDGVDNNCDGILDNDAIGESMNPMILLGVAFISAITLLEIIPVYKDSSAHPLTSTFMSST